MLTKKGVHFKKSLSLTLALLLVVTFTIALIPTTVNAASFNYYVATDGNDNNDGTTLITPFKTIQRAANVAAAGDTVYIRGGVYRETVNPANSGTADSPITFEAYQNEDVQISGLDTVDSQWTQYSGSIYQTEITLGMGDMNAVFVGDNPMTYARWPNKGGANNASFANSMINDGAEIDDGTFTGTDGSAGNASITDADMPNQGLDWYNGAIVWYIAGAKWTALGATITSSGSGTINFTVGDMGSYDQPGDVSRGDKNYYYLAGKLGLLDVQNEWFYDEDNNKLYLYAPDGVDPNDLDVEVKARLQAIDLTDKSYIHFNKVNIMGAEMKITGDYNVIDGMNASYIFSHNARGMYHTHPVTDDGIHITGNYNTIKNGDFSYSDGNIFLIDKGDGNVIDNNYIHDVDINGCYDAAFRLEDNNGGVGFTTITRNTITNCGRSAIHFCRPAYFMFNDVSHTNIVCDDGSAIYLGGHLSGSEVAYNKVHDIYWKSGSRNGVVSGIYMDGGSFDATAHHNLLYNIGQDGAFRFNSNSTGRGCFNNTTYNCPITFDAHDGDATGAYFIDNNLHNAPASTFVDAAGGNFTLAEGSDAINAGNMHLPWTLNYTGTAPDKGCFEYGVSAWNAGVGSVVSYTPTTKIKVACIGDSITSGYNTTGYDVGTPNGYVQQLAGQLGSKFDVKGFSTLSATVLAKGQEPFSSSQEYADSKAWLPDVVVIMLGTHDAINPDNWQYKADFLSDYETMIGAYQGLDSHPLIYVTTPPTAYTSGVDKLQDSVISGEIIPLEQEAAEDTGCTVIDVHTATQGMPQNFEAIHPNDTGAGVVAGVIYTALTGAQAREENKAPEGPEGYTWCANEGQAYDFGDKLVDVAFGAMVEENGQKVLKFSFLRGVTGKVSFDVGTFGDPAPGVDKFGFYKNAVVAPPNLTSIMTIEAEDPGNYLYGDWCFIGSKAHASGGMAADTIGWQGPQCYLQFNNVKVDVSGNYYLKITYCTGNQRDADISINGGPAANYVFSTTDFSDNWDVWGDQYIPVVLYAGNNTVRIFNSKLLYWAPLIDKIEILRDYSDTYVPEPLPEPPTAELIPERLSNLTITSLGSYEAEDAAVSGGWAYAADKPNASGAKAVVGLGVNGDCTVKFDNVSVPKNDEYNIRITYTNGDPRNASIIINGSDTPIIREFPATGGYDNWKTMDIKAVLNEGANTIIYGNATTLEMAPPIDKIEILTAEPTVTAPDIVVPSCGLKGVAVNYTGLKAVDYLDGSVPILCDIPSGSVFQPGITTVNYTAADSSGNTVTSSFKVTVPYCFTGLFKPVDMNGAENIVKAGSAIPLKFSLNGYKGLDIFEKGYPASVSVGDFAAGLPSDAVVVPLEAAGDSGLTYDALSDQYTFVWKTDKAWAGTNRQVVIKMKYGTSVPLANFKFTK